MPKESVNVKFRESPSTNNGANNNVGLSLPELLRLRVPDDVTIDDQVKSNAPNLSKRGKLHGAVAKRHGFEDVFIKSFREDRQREKIHLEVSILATLQPSSQCVIRLVGFLETPLSLVTRYYRNGSLRDLIQSAGSELSYNIVHQLALDIVTGMVSAALTPFTGSSHVGIHSQL